MSTKPVSVVFVIGATGNVGSATVTSLAAKYADKVEIRAGVRNPEKADKLKSLAGVKIIQATMGEEKLVQTLAGVDTLFINTPPTDNRAQLAIATAEQAKKAGVKQIVVVSIAAADLTNTIFGRQFTEIEGKISKLGIAYTFIRLPAFTDNHWSFKDTIVKQGTIYCPADPEIPYNAIAVEDAGSASAAILVNPASYANKTIQIASDQHSLRDVSQGFTDILGKEIKYVRVPYEATKKVLTGMGMPERQVDGLLELYKLIDESNPAISSDGDVGVFTDITGETPTDLKKWLAKYGRGFQ